MNAIQMVIDECARPKGKRLTPMKAIKAKCLDCCCGSRLEVKLCPATDCMLWRYRFGRKPNMGGQTYHIKGHSPQD